MCSVIPIICFSTPLKVIGSIIDLVLILMINNKSFFVSITKMKSYKPMNGKIFPLTALMQNNMEIAIV